MSLLVQRSQGRNVEARPGHPDDRDTGRGGAVGDARFVYVVLGAIIILQRFALPFGGGQVPFVLPVVLAAVAWAVHRGVVGVEPVRRQLFLITVVWCAGVATIASWRGLPWSALSILYLAMTYMPFIFCLRRPTTHLYRSGLSLFLRLMYVAAVIGIAQVGLQLLGFPYADPFAALPSPFVMQGYTTSYPVVYGSSIFKANGILFLEASFFSQFLALALVIHLYLRRRGVGGYLLIAGMIASVSGTGIILALVGVVALGVSEGRRHLVRMAAGVVVLASLVALSPVGSIFTSRLDESSSSTSSAKGRFSVPYEVSVSDLTADPLTLSTGQGPGAAERSSAQLKDETGLTAVFPVVPKVALEYGLPALVIFLCFIVTSTLSRVPSTALALPALVMYFALSGSLLQPVTVYTVYALTSLFAVGGARSRPEPLPAGSTSARAARIS